MKKTWFPTAYSEQARHLSKKDVIPSHATVQYMPGHLGPMPAKGVHQLFYNSDLLVENVIHCGNWQN